MPGPRDGALRAGDGDLARHADLGRSPTFLKEIVDGWHGFIPDSVRNEIRGKYFAGCAAGILNAPDTSDNPATDSHIPFNYGPADHREAKRKNKLAFQREMGLTENADAPIFFWPSRLDPVQKGPQRTARRWPSSRTAPSSSRSGTS